VAGWLPVILIATSSGLGRYSMAMFSLHMAVHMLLSIMAPILLVLGGPVTLALRALPVAGAGNPPGPREWLLAFTRSWIVRMSMHPLMALGMYIALFYVMYFTSLYDTVAPSHWVHLLMNAHFPIHGLCVLLAHYWHRPYPRQLFYLGRLGLLLAAMPFHAFFGISLTSSATSHRRQLLPLSCSAVRARSAGRSAHRPRDSVGSGRDPDGDRAGSAARAVGRGGRS
jgi:putative copper resistance protein D